MKALGKITGDCLLRAAALAVAGGLLLTGCIKEDAGSCGGPDGEVTVGFRAGTLAIAGASDADDGWNVRSAKGRVQAVRSADAATRADVPPAPDPGPDVENPDDLPVGTTFRVLVYEAGADPQSESPVDQNTYKIADAGGTIVATAVDGKGNATEGAARELVLRRGAYDFYYFSPAVPAGTAMPNPGRYTGLMNGADYMALAHREVIDPSQGPKHYIPEVCLYRMGSYIDVRISPRDGEIMGSLAVTGDGLQLWGLPASGSYEIGDYPYRLVTEGSGGMVEFSPGDFAAEEGTTTTVSTLGTGGGRAVLPGYARDLQVKVTLTSDGKEMKLDASLAGYNFAPGYRYVVELGVGRIADKPELDIEILPWNEYDWGDDGQIGGGGYLPIDTGGGTVIEPDPKRKGTWQEAVDYCSGKGGGWRLPTENELYYYWYVEPSVNGVSPFMEGDYWSSTNNASNSGQAWTFNFSFGEARAYKKDKATSLYMRCVRDKESGAGTKYPYVKSEGNSSVIVLRDAAGGIDKASLFASRPTVTAAVAGGQHSENDRMSGMLQVQNADPGLMNWYDAIDYCDNLAQEGYDDWRMPTLRELMLIWTVGGNNNVGSLDIDNSTDSPVQRPVGSSWLHSLAGFTVLPNKVVYSATWCEEEPDLWPDIKWVMRISGTDGRVNDDGVGATSEGVRKTQAVRCVRDWDGSAPTSYTVSEASVTPAGDIPGEGKPYSLTLTGVLPAAGVEVCARVDGQTEPLVSGKVTASGTAVELAVPANMSYTERSVTFQYKFNGKWLDISPAVNQAAGYSVTGKTHNAPATIPGQGGTYSVTLTGTLPAAGVEVRANISGANPVTGKVSASGTAVSLTIPGNLSYNPRTVTFEYLWNGTWTKIGDACTQQGWNVTAASVTPAGDIPQAGGTYTVTLTGWGGYKIRAINRVGTEVKELVVKNDYQEVPNYSASIVIPANTETTTREVTFQYWIQGAWKDIETRTQEEKSLIGELYGGGVIYWVNPDDKNDFRVVALDESQKAWAASRGYVLGSGAQSQSARNGAAIMTLVRQYSANHSGGASGTFATDFPAFGYCYNKTPVGTWYLPSKQELTDLYAAKGSVESVITANGGTAFSAGVYWSATESSSFNSATAWFMNFSTGYTVYDYKSSSSKYVRCVRSK